VGPAITVDSSGLVGISHLAARLSGVLPDTLA
jgi:hypothetical protein